MLLPLIAGGGGVLVTVFVMRMLKVWVHIPFTLMRQKSLQFVLVFSLSGGTLVSTVEGVSSHPVHITQAKAIKYYTAILTFRYDK